MTACKTADAWIRYFEEEDNYLYTIAQFYPRLVVYMDNEGWQNKQFLGSGEFTLNLEITTLKSRFRQTSSASTGVLKNEKSVLTPTQRKLCNESVKRTTSPYDCQRGRGANR